MRHQRPTLLVFTRGPGREAGQRRWLPGVFAALERELHERCLTEVLAAGREAGCRLRVSTPDGRRPAADVEVDRQGEGRFGERLLGAIERAHRAATGPLVVVGTDTPGITGRVLDRALAALRRDPEEVVLGPAADGGIYLLATARPLARQLVGVRWRCSTTLASMVSALRAGGRPVRLLPVRRDLDTRRDLERWLAGAAGRDWRDLAAALRSALARLAAAVAPPAPPVPAEAWLELPVGRAPPR